MIKTSHIKCRRQERGQALILVLVLLMLGSLTLSPLLSHMSTTLKTGQVYASKAAEFYAADSGVEDAIWQIKYDRLSVLFDDPEYDMYDFANAWSYNLDEPINGLSANVTIQNVWIPKDITPLSPSEARATIESNKLMVAGTASGETGYKIKINFTPAEGEENSLVVMLIGIWLPVGFSYVDHSCNLEDDEEAEYYSEPSVEDYAGGQAVVWGFDSVPFTAFPGVSTEDEPMTTEITFDYLSSQPGVSPVAISWMVTNGDVSDVPISWDIDTRIYKITSVAGDTEIEAYSAKCELRKMGAAIAGDYRAIGNSLMQDNSWPYDKRDTLLAESDAEVSDIPTSADVIAAYLYWSGWFDQGTPGPAIWQDDFTTSDNWTLGSSWVLDTGRFKGHDETGRYLTMTDSIDLSSYLSGPAVVVSWQQWEYGSLNSDDKLQYQFSANGGVGWSSTTYTAFSNDIGTTPVTYTSDPIPSTYLTNDFKFRFRLNDFNAGDQFCYVDNFTVSDLVYAADTDVVFKINGTQVFLDAQGDPQIGTENITAGESEVLENQPGQYSYACHRNVTKLVKAYSDLGDGENHTGNGTYTAGGVDADTGDYWSYAGWSLIIIYSSPETAGHQLYLYDTFAFNGGDENLDFDNDGLPGGDITGFFIPDPSEDLVQYPNAASLTCFVGEGDSCYDGDYLRFEGTNLSDGAGDLDDVWDSESIGMSEPGVDIDTFYVTWASGLLEPGDTTAHLDMPSSTDNWNLIYIILSLRSETVTGGTTHYVIHGS